MNEKGIDAKMAGKPPKRVIVTTTIDLARGKPIVKPEGGLGAHRETKCGKAHRRGVIPSNCIDIETIENIVAKLVV